MNTTFENIGQIEHTRYPNALKEYGYLVGLPDGVTSVVCMSKYGRLGTRLLSNQVLIYYGPFKGLAVTVEYETFTGIRGVIRVSL